MGRECLKRESPEPFLALEQTALQVKYLVQYFFPSSFLRSAVSNLVSPGPASLVTSISTTCCPGSFRSHCVLFGRIKLPREFAELELIYQRTIIARIKKPRGLSALTVLGLTS